MGQPLMCVAGWLVWVRGSNGIVVGNAFVDDEGMGDEGVMDSKEVIGSDTLGSVDEELMLAS